MKRGKDFVILHFILDINKVDKQCLKTKYTSFKGYLESQSLIVDLIIRLDLKWERLPSLFIEGRRFIMCLFVYEGTRLPL